MMIYIDARDCYREEEAVAVPGNGNVLLCGPTRRGLGAARGR